MSDLFDSIYVFVFHNRYHHTNYRLFTGNPSNFIAILFLIDVELYVFRWRWGVSVYLIIVVIEPGLLFVIACQLNILNIWRSINCYHSTHMEMEMVMDILVISIQSQYQWLLYHKLPLLPLPTYAYKQFVSIASWTIVCGHQNHRACDIFYVLYLY